MNAQRFKERFCEKRSRKTKVKRMVKDENGDWSIPIVTVSIIIFTIIFLAYVIGGRP